MILLLRWDKYHKRGFNIYTRFMIKSQIEILVGEEPFVIRIFFYCGKIYVTFILIIYMCTILVVLNTVTMLYNHHHCLSPKLFIIPNKNFVPIK